MLFQASTHHSLVSLIHSLTRPSPSRTVCCGAELKKAPPPPLLPHRHRIYPDTAEHSGRISHGERRGAFVAPDSASRDQISGCRRITDNPQAQDTAPDPASSATSISIGRSARRTRRRPVRRCRNPSSTSYSSVSDPGKSPKSQPKEEDQNPTPPLSSP